MSEDGTATVQAEDADVEFFHSAIAKKWGLCLWDEDCPEGEFCQKHHCEVSREPLPPVPRRPCAPCLRSRLPPAETES